MKPLLLSLFATFAMALSAQSIDTKLLDNYFDSLAYHDRSMGSLSIYIGQEEVYRRAIGFADTMLTQAATPDHVYRVGSITKTFTAVIIHKLVEAGQLSLDDRLSKFYPELPNADDITIDQLLRHRSGLSNYTDSEDFLEYIDQDQTPAQMAARIQQLEPDFTPGEAFKYSNSGYLILGYIAERVSSKPYLQLLRDYIIEPAGLVNTYVGGPIDPARREVASFARMKDGWQNASGWSMANVGAAGNLSSTATDLNKFYRKLLRGELLDKEVVAEMTRMTDGYGHGLIQLPFNDQFGYGHTGGIEGFRSMSAHFPDKDITVTYLSNAEDVGVNDVMLAALTVANGLPYAVPDFTPVPDLPEAEMQGYVGTYASDDFPLDIEIFIENGKLLAQATGQGAFPLTPDGPDKFIFSQAGISMKFDAKAGTMQFKQGPIDMVMQRQ